MNEEKIEASGPHSSTIFSSHLRLEKYISHFHFDKFIEIFIRRWK